MAAAWFTSGNVHPQALADSGGWPGLLAIFQHLDDTGLTWQEYEEQPWRITLLRMQFYDGRRKAEAMARRSDKGGN